MATETTPASATPTTTCGSLRVGGASTAAASTTLGMRITVPPTFMTTMNTRAEEEKVFFPLPRKISIHDMGKQETSIRTHAKNVRPLQTVWKQPLFEQSLHSSFRPRFKKSFFVNHRSTFSTMILSKPLGTGERNTLKMTSRMAPCKKEKKPW